MIAFLKEWIISVAAMVIFMVLIDLILPSNNFRKYAKFVTGLIVIITILSPVFKLFDKNIDAASVISNYAESFEQNQSKTDSSVNGGIQKQTLEVFKSNLKASIEKEILNELGKKYSVSDINIIEDSKSSSFGDIKGLILKKENDEKTVKPVEKVVIGSSQAPGTEIPRDNKVTALLKSKYNIDPSSVKFVK